MSAIGLFMQDPFAFLENNLVIVPFTDKAQDRLADDPIELTFYSLPKVKAVASKLGRELGLYFVTRPDAIYNPDAVKDGRTLKAYFCPYNTDDTLGTVVSKKADYMFTTAMDGCTLGIGMAAGDGSRLIYHSNLAKYGEKQGTLQAETLKLVFGAGLETMFGPEDYRKEFGQDSLLSTTFGVRSKTTNGWNFYGQVYTKAASGATAKYYLREVKKVL